MKRGPRPFLVIRSLVVPGKWLLYMRNPKLRAVAYFDSQGEAIDHAYRNWPWWP